MEISLKADIKQLTKGLNRAAKKQIPFATSKALNLSGVKVLAAMNAQVKTKFEGGATASTLRAFKVPRGLRGKRHNIEFSDKKDLSMTIKMPSWAEEYLQWQVFGGVKAESKKQAVPTHNKRLNKFGNIAGRKSGLVKGNKEFIATIKGITGVWKRVGKGGRQVKLLIAFEDDVAYKPKFPFFKIGTFVFNSQFPKLFRKELANAIKTAK